MRIAGLTWWQHGIALLIIVLNVPISLYNGPYFFGGVVTFAYSAVILPTLAVRQYRTPKEEMIGPQSD